MPSLLVKHNLHGYHFKYFIVFIKISQIHIKVKHFLYLFYKTPALKTRAKQNEWANHFVARPFLL